MLGTVISKPLETLFNVSFSMGIVPSNFKIAKVLPIYKNGSPTSTCNYRPISLLSVFNKLLEKLMSNRLLDFIQRKAILFDNHFGFRAKHSTDFAVLSIIDKIRKAIDERDFSCGIFLDLSKAFDTVNHEILIKKLEHYGVRGVAKNWFEYSSTNIISCGVPQESVLGPILFVLYVNDFHHSSNLFDFHLFADDANLFYRHKNINILQSDVNTELNSINVWLCANKLSLNVENPNFVLSYPSQRKIGINLQLSINDKIIKQCYSVKYLGILIDLF
jgi:hypothetical protein